MVSVSVFVVNMMGKHVENSSWSILHFCILNSLRRRMVSVSGLVINIWD